MRFLSSLLVLSLVASQCSMGYTAPARKIVPRGTVSFTSKSQKFSVWLPTRPSQNQQVINLKGGEKGSVSTFEVTSKGVSYLIVSAFIGNLSKKAQGDLDLMQKNFLNSSGGTLLKRQDLRLSGHPGRELTVKSLLERPVRTRMYQTPQFVYQIVAQGEDAAMKKQTSQINRVFDSFRILSTK